MRLWFAPVLVLGLAACGSASPAAPASNATTTPPSVTASTSSSSTIAASSAPAAEGQALLAALRAAPYQTSGSGTSGNVQVARDAVAGAAPGKKLSDLDFVAASDTTISVGDSFLFSHNAQAAHGYDEVLAFAFVDQDGRCEAVGAVIPQAAEGKASDSITPTVFVTIDVSALTRCTASDAADAYTG